MRQWRRCTPGIVAPPDPYFYLGTNVLKNKLGLRDADALRTLEDDTSGLRIRELAVTPIQGKFDFDHLKAIHKHIFQDVYEWAGQPRTIDMGKAESVLSGLSVAYPSPHDPFPPDNLFNRADYAFEQLAKDNHLKGLDADTFAKQLAEHGTEIWHVHPFREGNTRATTAFVRQLAGEAGHPLVGELSRAPRELRDAFVLSTNASPEKLTALIKDAMSPSLGRDVVSAQHTLTSGKQEMALTSGAAQRGMLAAKLTAPNGNAYAVFETTHEFALAPWRDDWARQLGRRVTFGADDAGIAFARGRGRGLSR